MHEFSMVTSLVDTIRAHLPPGSRPRSARVRVGALEHLDPELMRTAWDALAGEAGWGVDRSPGSAEGAVPTLHLQPDPVRVRCRGCDHEYAPPELSWMVCPRCQRALPHVVSGTGVTLLSLSVDQPAPQRSPHGAPQPKDGS